MRNVLASWAGRAWIAVAVVAAAAIATQALAGSLAGSGNSYTVHALVSDVSGAADQTDPLLVNGWGLAALPTSPWWVNDNGTDYSTLYKADGTKVPLNVVVPGAPTGMVANTGSDFVVSENGKSGPALFIFSTEGGQILGWNPNVALNHAVLAKDNSGNRSIFKGLAIADDKIYATDFHHADIHVFSGNWHRVEMPGAFVDPDLPAGYAPFGIQAVGDMIVVTYARQGGARTDEKAGPGRGFVDAYDTSGHLLRRLVSHTGLNAPWGVAWAPADFGHFSGDLLIGNFGDGTIQAYAPTASGTFQHVGQLRDGSGNPIVIDGLWAIEFGLGSANNGPTNTLFFTAGPDDESHGLFGSIAAN